MAKSKLTTNAKYDDNSESKRKHSLSTRINGGNKHEAKHRQRGRANAGARPGVKRQQAKLSALPRSKSSSTIIQGKHEQPRGYKPHDLSGTTPSSSVRKSKNQITTPLKGLNRPICDDSDPMKGGKDDSSPLIELTGHQNDDSCKRVPNADQQVRDVTPLAVETAKQGGRLSMLVERPSSQLTLDTDASTRISPAADSDPAPRTSSTGYRVCCCIKIVLGIVGALVLLAFIVVYIVVPCLFYWSSNFRRIMVFRTFTGVSTGFADPESLGIKCSRNYYISSDEGSRLGTWYIQSQALPCAPNGTMFLGDSMTALYIHGVSGDRHTKPRVNIVQVLSGKANLHIVAFDFRGFGDSTDVTPSLQRVVNDTLAVYRSIRAVLPPEKIVIWGHSLGTSVALYVLSKLKQKNDTPSALVLESAFDTLGTVAKVTPYARPWRWMPCFNALVPDRIMADPATRFNSTAEAYKLVRSLPILMLHAEDDPVVPISNGRILRNAIVSTRHDHKDSAPVIFVPFKASHRYGHNLMGYYPGLSGIVKRFLNSSSSMSTIMPPQRR